MSVHSNSYRVGDLIDIGDDKVKCSVITSVNSVIVTVHIRVPSKEGTDDIYTYPISIWSVKGVKINEFLLKTMGFEKSDKMDNRWTLFLPLKGMVCLDPLSNKEGTEYCVHVDNLMGCTIGTLDVRFIHQIQHIIADTLDFEFVIKVV